MATFKNAAPKLVYSGINDKSTRPLVREPETFPQHLPLLRLFTETGPTETTLVNHLSGGINAIFGSQSLARRGKFFNTQSLLAETLLAEGNALFIKRLKPEDAPDPARLIVAIDIVEDEIPAITNPLAGFNYPNTPPPGSPANNDEVTGFRARLVLIQDNETEIGQQQITAGGIVSRDAVQSQVYPLFEMPASFFGESGNLLGIRLWTPTTDDSTPFDQEAADMFLTRMYRMQFMRRDTPASSAITVRTVMDEEYVDFSFTEGAYSPTSDKEYYAGDVITQAYEDDGHSSGSAPIYSPFEQIFVYHDNLATVQQMIFDQEMVVNPSASLDIQAATQIDPFQGIDQDGNRYHSLYLEGPLMGGVSFNKETIIYASGGGDGTTDLEMYEKLVDRENRNFGELGDDYDNLAVYPFSVVYDTGLSMDAKFEMVNILSKRQDIRAVFTTFVEAEGRKPSRSEELSRTQALMARLRAAPESMLYSTPVCRAEIIQQTGELAEGGYNRLVPQVIDYAQRWARFAGAGTGNMREGRDIDVSPNNRVEMVKNLNVSYFNERVQSELWASGATYSLPYDRRGQFYPSLHSVYRDDTSVLVSPITVSICCDLIRLIRLVHADFSGNARLTKEQLIERADARILELVDGRYNGRVVIVPRTYITAADEQRGFSWHCKIEVYANNPRNVMIFDLETHRMEDLEQ